jgi:hypothetical protein
MPRLIPARCSVQIGQAGGSVGKLLAPLPRAHEVEAAEVAAHIRISSGVCSLLVRYRETTGEY